MRGLMIVSFLLALLVFVEGRTKEKLGRPQHLVDSMYDASHNCEHKCEHHHSKSTHVEPKANTSSANHESLKSPRNSLDPKELFKCEPDQGCTLGLVCRQNVCKSCLSDSECPKGRKCVPSPQVVRFAVAVGIGIGPNAGAEAHAKVKPKFRSDKGDRFDDLVRLVNFLRKNYPEGAPRCQKRHKKDIKEAKEELESHEEEEEEYLEDNLL